MKLDFVKSLTGRRKQKLNFSNIGQKNKQKFVKSLII